LGSKLSVQIRERYDLVCEKIERAASTSGRPSDSVKLVVVSKTQSLETVSAAIEAGILVFGENYAEEAVGKIKAVQGWMPGITWHMIGHVQSRKANLVAQYFDSIHSLDSLKLAVRLDRFAGEYGRRIPVLLECNLSGEESKSGFPVFDEKNREIFITGINELAGLANLEIRGLMTMPPLWDDPENNRPYFRQLRQLREHLSEIRPNIHWKELSMGTSADFAIAVEEGATLVRIGTAILGTRV